MKDSRLPKGVSRYGKEEGLRLLQGRTEEGRQDQAFLAQVQRNSQEQEEVRFASCGQPGFASLPTHISRIRQLLL